MLQYILIRFHTIKHLKFRQIFYRFYYPFRNKFFPVAYRKRLSDNGHLQTWENSPFNHTSHKDPSCFSFLNLEHSFEKNINWDFSGYGKLWTYNLNYFDFLNQKDLDPGTGIRLISNYLLQDENNQVGKEPYPTSLRIVNLIKFISRHQIKKPEFDQLLSRDIHRLSHNLEYHLLGNHLLENGLALFFGAVYFRDHKMLDRAKKVIMPELKEQILNDGGHYERSPMYHNIILHRLLDCYKFGTESVWTTQEAILPMFKTKASSMLSWLSTIVYQNGDIPMVKDAAPGIALPVLELFDYAKSLKIDWEPGNLTDSDFRKRAEGEYEFFYDIGVPSPAYQPGHSHADTFSFELHFKGQPMIIDPGVSTYESGPVREKQRSTTFHNTVSVEGRNSSRVWGAFRVAQRASVTVLEDSFSKISATHDGYRNIGSIHQRAVNFLDKSICIEDTLKEKKRAGQAFFHLAPGQEPVLLTKDSMVRIMGLNIQFQGEDKIQLAKYDCPQGFNKTRKAHKIIVNFKEELKTTITFPA